mgnify:CR=1 FL=1
MLELKNIKKSYDGVTILKDISISIENSEIVSILGSSGSGKTTLLNLILGIIKPDSGNVIFDGKDLTNVPMELRGFNIVFQDYALFPNLNAYKNITYGLRNYPGRSTQQEVDSLIDLLDLRQHLDKKIDKLSGGQKQRISIARVFLKNPKILILDEATSALDNESEQIVKKSLDLLAQGRTTLIVAHRLTTIKNADNILVMTNDGIEESGTHEDLIKKNGIYAKLYEMYSN